MCSILWTSKALPGCIPSHLTDCSVRSGRRWAAVRLVEHGWRTANRTARQPRRGLQRCRAVSWPTQRDTLGTVPLVACQPCNVQRGRGARDLAVTSRVGLQRARRRFPPPRTPTLRGPTASGGQLASSRRASTRPPQVRALDALAQPARPLARLLPLCAPAAGVHCLSARACDARGPACPAHASI